jgi:serine/threonine protein phosphatase PrpC
VEAHVWFEQDFKEPQEFSFCGGILAVFTCRCPSKESSNEDSMAVLQISPHHGVVVVADGVGGASVGARASRAAVEAIVDSIKSSTRLESHRVDIVDAIEAANGQILSWGLGAGTTIAVVEYFDRSLRTFHVGDSTVLICSNRGKLKYNTVAHAPIAMAVEIGLMEEQQALDHEDRNLINNCLGCDQMKIELGSPIPMGKRDTVVIGSDGLSDNLTTEEIVNCIRAGRLSSQVAEMLATIQSRMQNPEASPSKPDDLTFVCFRQK